MYVSKAFESMERISKQEFIDGNCPVSSSLLFSVVKNVSSVDHMAECFAMEEAETSPSMMSRSDPVYESTNLELLDLPGSGICPCQRYSRGRKDSTPITRARPTVNVSRDPRCCT